MPLRKATPESPQSIPEMVADLTREEMRQMYKRREPWLCPARG